jgi:multicomponent Na+:H+ antiporter subunit D
MIGVTTVAVVLGLGIAVAAGPIYDLSERAAANLVDPTQYLAAVLQ